MAVAEPTKLDAALALAAKGLRIFPLQSGGKIPDIDGWTEKATTDAATIKRWWVDPVMGLPQDRNIGVLTGNGLMVLDVDNKSGKPGNDSLMRLEMANASDPARRTLSVRTPSTGRHIYFKTPTAVANSAGRLGAGLDVRGHHGYVVGPGSTTDAGRYVVESDYAIAEAPRWLVGLCGEARTREADAGAPSVRPSVELDQTGAIDAATRWLKEQAPLAVQGNAGNATTYKVAAKLRDFGVREHTALDLMIEHWNERCSPPWTPDELRRVGGNAYRYGQNPQGAAMFDPIPGAAPVRDLYTNSGQQPTAPHFLTPFDPAAIPRRRRILGHLAYRGIVSVIIAPGGAGKSTLTIGATLATATGKNLLGDRLPVHERTAAWLYNNEDDEDELKRRIAAAMQHYDVQWSDLMHEGRPMLAVNSGERHPFLAMKRTAAGDAKVLRPTDDLRAMAEHVRANNIGLVVLDPFAETHQGTENSNEEILEVASHLRNDLAKATGCALVLVHHTRKPATGTGDGHVGNMDSARGASALVNAARVAATLYGMSEKDAKAHGVPDTERHFYVRLDDAKANLSAPAAGKPHWFRKVSVTLPPSATGEPGDQVGVLAPAQLREAIDPKEQEMKDTLRAVLSVRGPSEYEATRAEVADRLGALPMYAELSKEALRARLRKCLDEPVEIDGWRLSTLTTGARGGKTDARIRYEPITEEADLLG